MKICIIIGTRPEIIKACPIIRYIEKNKISYYVIDTGQHYSYNLNNIFFDELDLNRPKYIVKCKRGSFKYQLASMLPQIKKILKDDRPNVVLVIGDTNSVIAGALASLQEGIPIGHVEAGLRSNDIMMLEETHRIIVDNISEFLFTPTQQSKENLVNEKHDPKKIFITGNTVVDALLQNMKLVDLKSDILNQLKLDRSKYILLCLHRQENVDYIERFKNILDSLKKVIKYHDLRIIWPIHPRALKMLQTFNFELSERIKIIDPVGYFDFLNLQRNALFVMTDSGGVQEETNILRIPCITLRDNTERPETIEVGSNILSGVNPDAVLDATMKMMSKPNNWKNPYGRGDAAKEIIKILFERL